MNEEMLENKEMQIPEEAIIEIIDMHKWFGEFHVLRGIDLTIRKKERIVICGPSGSGKSTLIRCINRLEEHQRGQIIVDGIELTNNLKNIEKIRAEVGMVFQHFNLFAHLQRHESLQFLPALAHHVRRPAHQSGTLVQRLLPPARRRGGCRRQGRLQFGIRACIELPECITICRVDGSERHVMASRKATRPL